MYEYLCLHCVSKKLKSDPNSVPNSLLNFLSRPPLAERVTCHHHIEQARARQMKDAVKTQLTEN
jgi:hypothetical protein